MTLAVVLLVGALAGCSPSPEPSGEPTPTFSSEEEAFAAAEETYRAYVDALNEVDLSDPETFEGVYAWTTGELNAQDRQNFSEWHAMGYVKSGDARVDSVIGRSASLEDAFVTIDACYNVAAVDVRDAEGDSLVDDSRPDVQALVVGLEQSDVTETGLAVASIESADGSATC